MNQGSSRRGFTVIEVLVAILVLGLGIVALVGSSGAVTRMIGQGKRNTRAAQVAERRLESLRQTAMASATPCTALANGSQTWPDRIAESWTVTSPTTTTRLVQLVVRYPTGRGLRADTVATILRCQA